MRTRRKIKQQLMRLRHAGPPTPATSIAVPAAAVPAAVPPAPFEAGTLVRVRSREEIAATLDPWDQLRGCGFMPEMAGYCGTTQRVLKPVLRFVDERDYKVKKTSGVYLLEGVMCLGTELFGPCDRGCLYFWREEWLEPLPAATAPA